jgi:hypothetical protein
MKVLKTLRQAFVTETGVRSRTLCLALALALVLLLFSDVIFLRSSLAPLDYDSVLTSTGGSVARSIIPERPGRRIWDGQGDLWSGSSQFQPAVRFMAFCLRSGESPSWDPYSATGVPGPEALIDLKFAPITLIAALFGGTSAALTFVLLGFFLGAAYCIMRTFTDCLQLSFEAAFAAAAIFFLNGFALANLYLAIGQPYLLAPVVLYAMLCFLRSQTPLHAAGAVCANAALLSTAFTPTAVLTLIVVYGTTLGLESTRPRREWRTAAINHLAIFVSAICLVAFLYVPVADALSTYMSDVLRLYRSRPSPGISLVNLFSLLTPKHFWEALSNPVFPATARAVPFEKVTIYLGICASLLAVHAWSGLKKRTAPVVAVATACFAASVGQIYGIFPFTLLDLLPFFSFVRNDYWASMTSLSFMMLVAYGYEAICARNAFSRATRVFVGLSAVAFLLLYFYLGLYGEFMRATSAWTKWYVVTFWMILLTATGLLMWARSPRSTARAKRYLLVGLIVEGLFYMNGLRPARLGNDVNLPQSIKWLKAEVAKHPGSRILNIGRYGVFPSWPSGLQIPSVDFLSYPLAAYDSFYRTYIGRDFRFAALGVTGEAVYLFAADALSLAGVRYVVVDTMNGEAATRLSGLGFAMVTEDAFRKIFENPHPYPRAFAVSDVQTLDGLPAERGLPADRSATTIDGTLLRELKAMGVRVDQPAGSLRPADVPGSVQVAEYHHDRVLLKCELQRAAMVVLTDSWSPRWSATVDRKPAQFGRVDVAFRGIAVAAGRHEIEFRYYPASRLAGQVISGITLLGLVCGLGMWQKRLRQGPGAGERAAADSVPAK